MSWWRRLGVYRTLPVFFFTGAAIEWFMINVRIGKETFLLYAQVPITYSMPAGMTWSRYLTFASSALVSMFLGASIVHNYYKPKLEVPDVPPSLSEQPKPTRMISLKSHDNSR